MQKLSVLLDWPWQASIESVLLPQMQSVKRENTLDGMYHRAPIEINHSRIRQRDLAYWG